MVGSPEGFHFCSVLLANAETYLKHATAVFCHILPNSPITTDYLSI
jgi:hypothetical protein